MTRLDHCIARTYPRLCYRTLLAGLVLGGATMLASGAVVAAPVTVSGTSPFSATCGLTAADGRLFLNSEVEPFIAANPTKASNLIAVWQQDRWSNGGSAHITTATRQTVSEDSSKGSALNVSGTRHARDHSAVFAASAEWSRRQS